MSGDEHGPQRSYHARRQRRAIITLLVVVLMLAGAFYYASTYFQASAPQSRPCTTIIGAQELRPADITVNVYNASAIRGAAATAGRVAAQRGFVVAAVANDPSKKAVKTVAEVRHGPEGLESAKVLLRHLPKGSALVADKRQGDTIDLVLGPTWKGWASIPVPPKPTTVATPCPTAG